MPDGVFSIQRQLENKWCWAAVAASVGEYRRPGFHFSQCRVATDVSSGHDCCADPESCNRARALEPALDAVGVAFRVVRNPLSFAELRDELRNDLPVCAFIKWRGGGGHFVVVSGFRRTVDGQEFVDVQDPFFPNSTIPYEIFVNTYMRGRRGRWKTSYLIRRSSS